jgi:hypothetical protein
MHASFTHSVFTQSVFAATLAFALLPARAVDVSGKVIAKSGAPISQAKVCVKSDTSKCVTTDPMGAFHITTASAIRESGARTPPYTLDFRNGILSLEAPGAGEAKVEWAGPGGRVFSPAQGLRLTRGRNVLAIPKGLPENGICFLRLRASGLTFTWKAVMMRGAATGRSQSGSPAPSGRIAALSKAAGTSTLEISKTGYRTRIYEPLEDPETGTIITMSATDDVGLSYTGAFTAKILAIDRAARTLIVENVDAYCEGENVKRDTTRDTSLYAFVGGKFWLWTKGECSGQAFTTTSSSTDPVGSFTLLDPAAELPEDLKAGCTPADGSGDSPFENFNASYQVTETQISGDISVEICPADFYGPFFTDFLLLDTNVTLAKNTCRQLVFKNGAGESGTLDFSKSGDSLQIAFAYKTEKCLAAQDFTLSNKAPVCPEDSASMEPFFFCMLESGFLDTAAIGLAPPAAAKTSAAVPAAGPRRLPMSREGVARWDRLPALRPLSAPKPGDPVRRGSIFPWHGWRIETARKQAR